MSGTTDARLNERLMFQPASDSPVADVVAPSARETHLPTKWIERSSIAGFSERIFAKPASMASRSVEAIEASATQEFERGAAFLLVPVLLAAGSFLYFSLSVEPSIWLTLFGVVVAAGATRLTPRGRPSHLASCAMLLIVLGVISAQFETWRLDTKIIGGEISTTIVGRVVAIEHLNNGRARLTVDIVSTERPKLRYAPDRIGRPRARCRKLSLPDRSSAGW